MNLEIGHILETYTEFDAEFKNEMNNGCMYLKNVVEARNLFSSYGFERFSKKHTFEF